MDRGYVSLAVRNLGTDISGQPSVPVRWDNVGFSGKRLEPRREFDADEAVVPNTRVEGCLVETECVWRGEAQVLEQLVLPHIGRDHLPHLARLQEQPVNSENIDIVLDEKVLGANEILRYVRRGHVFAAGELHGR